MVSVRSLHNNKPSKYPLISFDGVFYNNNFVTCNQKLNEERGMKNNLSLTILAILIMINNDCSNEENTPDPVLRTLTSQEHTLVKASNDFGWRLFTEVAASTSNKNIFISPLSVSSALGMANNGATDDTLANMTDTLGLKDLTNQETNEAYKNLISLLLTLDPEVKINIANSIWYRDVFAVESEFINTNKIYFDAEVNALDFDNDNAADTINSWVYSKTNGLIDTIVKSPLKSVSVMYLINAIYFKGDWANKFEKTETADETFHGYMQDTIIKMMHLNNISLPYVENDLFQAVDLPYVNGHFRMMVILPQPEVNIDQLLSELNTTFWSQLTDSLTNITMNLALPKFTFNYSSNLNEVLKTLGMGIAFDCELAQFTRINKDIPICITNVEHKSFIEVDEEGTKAAAATSVEMGVTAAPPSYPMRVDRPFIIILHDTHSQAVLFAGKILNL